MRSVVPLLATALCAGLSAATKAPRELEPRAYSPNPTESRQPRPPRLRPDAGRRGRRFLDPVARRVGGAQRRDPALTEVTFGLFGRSGQRGHRRPVRLGLDRGSRRAETFRAVSRARASADARLRPDHEHPGRACARTTGVRAPPSPRRTTLRASRRGAGADGQHGRDEARSTSAATAGRSARLSSRRVAAAGRARAELYAGPGLFTPNDDFFSVRRRCASRTPFGTFQVHTSYNLPASSAWRADATLRRGVSTTLDGVEKDDRLSNTRLGLTAAIPLGRHQSVKLAWGRRASPRGSAANFDSYSVQRGRNQWLLTTASDLFGRPRVVERVLAEEPLAARLLREQPDPVAGSGPARPHERHRLGARISSNHGVGADGHVRRIRCSRARPSSRATTSSQQRPRGSRPGGFAPPRAGAVSA